MKQIYTPKPAYPTPAHAAAAQAIAERFGGETEAVLLLNSCARGKASPDSCLDMGLLLRPEQYAANGAALEKSWEKWYGSAPVFRGLEAAGWRLLGGTARPMAALLQRSDTRRATGNGA